MAVEFLSVEVKSANITGSPYQTSTPIVVPNDCDAIVITYGYYNGAHDMVSAAIGGDSFIKAISRAGYGGHYGTCGIWILPNPPTGNQTVNIQWTLYITGWVNLFFHYLKGVDTDNPIRDADISAEPGSPSAYQAWTTPNMDAYDGDMAFAAVFDYEPTNGQADADPVGSGQTETGVQYVNTNYGHAAGYKSIAADGPTTVTGVGNYAGTVGAVIAGLESESGSYPSGSESESGSMSASESESGPQPEPESGSFPSGSMSGSESESESEIESGSASMSGSESGSGSFEPEHDGVPCVEWAAANRCRAIGPKCVPIGPKPRRCAW